MKNENFIQWRLWAPIVSGYIISTMCPITQGEGALLAQRPPAYVFGIVWPVLYILLGISWIHARGNNESDIMHGVLTIFLCLWIIMFSCFHKKKYGLYILSCIIALTVSCMCLQQHRWSKVALTPLLAWTSLAHHLNYHILD